MRKPCRIGLILVIALSFLVSVSAQEEDIDTASATLILNIERALSIEVLGGPFTLTIGLPDLQKRSIPLEGLQVRVYSLVPYQVAAYGEVYPLAEAGALQLRVEGISGPFEEVLAPDFLPLGPVTRPLPLFSGGNNIGLGTVATLGLRFDLSRLAAPLASSYTFILSFMVVER
ncbi:MAG: hypothetical protein ACUVRH_07605 [Candidatus Bipolaricaulia bacterium]